MTFSENIADILSFANMQPILIIAIIVGVCAILLFLLSERNRMIASEAANKLKKITQDEKTIKAISEEYDVHSSKNIMHAEYESLQKTAAKRKWLTAISIVTATFIMLSALTIFAIVDTYTTAKKHAYMGDLNVTASSLWRGINGSPIESELPENLSKAIVIYYRFGCPDCEATYPTLSKTLSAYTDVYWVSSRSDQGVALKEKYPIEVVPTGIYIKDDGTYLTYILYQSTADGPVLDTTELQHLISAATYDRGQNKDKEN